jgi:hypothetical protein
MPTNYTFKRLIGWFKRVGGTNVAFLTYEAEGGAIDMAWTTPTLDINQANSLTTSRRTDALKVPLNFSTIAHIRVEAFDAASGFNVILQCPDETDAAPSVSAAPLEQLNGAAGVRAIADIYIRTSAAGLIAARTDLATVDLYVAVTIGFRWARRN